MTHYRQTWILFLSQKRTTIAIIIFAICSRFLQLFFFYNMGDDGAYQMRAMQSFLAGKGYSLALTNPQDLSSTVYEPLINWPPGYSLLLAPFYQLWGDNYAAAGITLDAISALVLLFTSRYILKLLEVPLYLRNLFTLFTGLFVYYFYYISSSDSVTIAFLSVAIFCALHLLKPGRRQWWLTSLMSVCLVAAAWIKYLFIPVSFALPAFLILLAYVHNDRKLKRSGFLSFLTVGVFVALLIFSQKSAAGEALYISAPGRGFFPQHLAEIHPFIPAAFIRPDTLALLISGNSDLPHALFYFLYWLNVIAFLWTGILIIRKPRSHSPASVQWRFLQLSYFLSATILSVLIFLSLRVEAEHIFPGHSWTYVEDPRYYGLVTVLLQLSAFMILHHWLPKKNNWKLLASGIFLIIMLPEMARGIYFSINRLSRLGKEEYSWQYEQRFQNTVATIIRNEKSTWDFSKLAVTGSTYLNARISIDQKAPVLKDFNRINRPSSLKSSEDVLLIVILHEKDLTYYIPFLQSKGNKASATFGPFYIFTHRVAGSGSMPQRSLP